MQIEVRSPFPDSAIPRIWTWISEFRNAVADDFAPKTIEEFISDWEARSQGPRVTWGVWRDGELVGLIVVDQISPILVTAHCLFAKRAWGHQTTVPAIRQMLDEIFAAGVRKVIGTPFAHNSQMIALMRELGFRREGTLVGHTIQHGKPVDMAAFGLFADDYLKQKEVAA